ncbi:MAG: acyl-CoA synthetase [Acidimicrobiia bacterium]|nr:acyl-CoA synthetase [Acidimicrobiia bacterium]
MQYNFADLWDAVAPRVADRTALVCGDDRRTYAELADRVSRLAGWLQARDVERGDFVGVHLTNGIEYLETMLACFSIGAVPVNVNFRYRSGELRHLYGDAGLVGTVIGRTYRPLLDEIRPDLDDLRWALDVDDGASVEVDTNWQEVTPYEDALATATALTEPPERSPDDLYVIYTGGTTGLPKGVVWRQEDAFFSCIGGGDPMRLLGPVSHPDEVLDRIVDGTFVFFPVAPLMHAAGQWTALSWLFAGGTVVLHPGSLDADAIWRACEREGVNVLAVVGDAVVRPLLDAWDEAGGYEVPSLISIGSGGAPLTPSLKDRLMDTLPNVGVVDGFGSSETGAQGAQRLEAGSTVDGVAAFTPYGDQTTVVDPATLERVVPGSGHVGLVARRGHIPLRYHQDPERTAATFVEVDGDRWVLTGDEATVADDGTITLLGRGSVCINTGGEKVHPEEVEAVLKGHEAVRDVVVVGAPDERWGQAVTAVVEPEQGTDLDADALVAHCRQHLAAYKVPRRVVTVPKVERTPAGKADYAWARTTATTES